MSLSWGHGLGYDDGKKGRAKYAKMLDSNRNDETTTWVCRLLDWYETSKRAMPWRDQPDPYRVWVAEVMLQQTQVKTVIPYFERFIERFPSPSHLAEACLDQVLKYWEGLGYYSRARYLYQAAHRIMTQHEGVLPSDYDALLALPGIGPYTAAAVASIAFFAPYPTIDGNAFRVFARLFACEDDIARPKSRRRFESLAKAYLPTDRPGDFNQAIMELGAVICRPQNPKCSICPLNSTCYAYALGKETVLPVNSKKRVAPLHHLSAMVIESDGSVLLRRRDEGLLNGFWAFPLFEVTDAEAVTFALLNTYGVKVDRVRYLGRYQHAFSHQRWDVSVFAGRWCRGFPRESGEFRWVTKEAFEALPLAIALKPIARWAGLLPKNTIG